MSSLTPEMLSQIAQSVLAAPAQPTPENNGFVPIQDKLWGLGSGAKMFPSGSGGANKMATSQGVSTPAAQAPQVASNMPPPSPMAQTAPGTPQPGAMPQPTQGPVSAGIPPEMQDSVRGQVHQDLNEASMTNAQNAGMLNRAEKKYDKQSGVVNAEQKAVAEQVAGVEQTHDQLLHEAYQTFQKRADEIDRREQEIVQESTIQAQNQLAKVNQAAAGVQNFQFQDFFAKQDTFGSILAIIAAAAGGAANGFARTPGAPTALDRVIDRDMQLQMTQFNQLKDNVSNQKGILSQMRDQTSDLMSGQIAMRKAIDAKMKVMIDDIGTKLGTPAAKLAQMKAQIDADSLDRDQKVTASYIGQFSNILGRDVGISTEKARLDEDIAKFSSIAERKAQAKPMNRQQANKLADTENAVNRIDKALAEAAAGKTPSPAEQRDLAEVIATARSNSGTGPKMADREVAGGIVSGSLPHPKLGGLSLPLNEYKTSFSGYDVQKLREMRAEIIEKQKTRDQGVAGGADDNLGE